VPIPQDVFAYTIAITVVIQYQNAFVFVFVFVFVLGSGAVQYFEVFRYQLCISVDRTMAETNAQRSQRRAHEGLIVETGVSRDTFAQIRPSEDLLAFPCGIRLLCLLNMIAQVGWDQPSSRPGTTSHVAGRWSSGWPGSIHTNNKVDYQGN
jgi:hypothetical protein